MNTQQVIDSIRQEWLQAMHGVSEQWQHLRQRANQALVPYQNQGDKHWGLVPVEMYRDGKQLIVHVELGGLDSDNVDVSIDGRELVIRGQRTAPPNSGNEVHYYHREIAYGQFERRIPLPQLSIDEEHNRAHCDRGMLSIELELLDTEDQPPRSISVH